MFGRNPTELEPKSTTPTLKHGDSDSHAMVWSSMSSVEVGEVIIIDGIMNADKYLKYSDVVWPELFRNWG